MWFFPGEQPLNVLRSFQGRPVEKRKAIAVVRKPEPAPFIPPQYVPPTVSSLAASGAEQRSSTLDIRPGVQIVPDRVRVSHSEERHDAAPAGQSRVFPPRSSPSPDCFPL